MTDVRAVFPRIRCFLRLHGRFARSQLVQIFDGSTVIPARIPALFPQSYRPSRLYRLTRLESTSVRNRRSECRVKRNERNGMIPYLKLMRISALPTLWANILTALCLGMFSVCGSPFPPGSGSWQVVCVLAASTCFYLAGMVLNDFFDAKIDAVERPERVIPSGDIPRWAAGVLGLAFLIFGWICVAACGRPNGNPLLYQAALVLTFCIVAYDACLKQVSFLGPIVMGTCRFSNVFFVLVFTEDVGSWSQLCPIEFGQLRGSLLYPWLVGIYVTALTILSRYETGSPHIRRLVGLGLAMLIPLDSLICLIFMGPVEATVVLCLYPVALGLRRIVPMT